MLLTVIIGSVKPLHQFREIHENSNIPNVTVFEFVKSDYFAHTTFIPPKLYDSICCTFCPIDVFN